MSLNIYMSLNITYKGLYLILLNGNTICPDFSPKLYNPPWFFFLILTCNLKPSLISSISKHLLNERNYNTLRYPHSLITAISYLIIIRRLCLFVPTSRPIAVDSPCQGCSFFPYVGKAHSLISLDLLVLFHLLRQTFPWPSIAGIAIYNLCILAYSQRKIQ